MKLAISGTYSTGKTTTSYALSYLTGIPRTHARTMREILPEALPGKRLEDCRPAELIQLGIRRLTERVLHESKLPEGYISDGSSLHEWIYGKVRMQVGIAPIGEDPNPPERDSSMVLFEEVIDNMGAVMKDHAKKSYDYFIHLPVEFPLVEDGHRPVSEYFRKMSDDLLINTLNELGIPYTVVGGSIPERLDRIVQLFNLPKRMSSEAAIDRAYSDIAQLNLKDERERVASTI